MKWSAVVVPLLLCLTVNCDVVVKHGSRLTVVDLTLETHEDIPKHPVYNKLNRTVNVFLFQDILRVKAEEICMPTHYGTHMDAPCHINGTWCLDNVPLERLVHLPTAVIDVRHRIFDGEKVINADYGVTVEDLLNWEKINGEIPEESLVLILTGWQRFWNDSIKYLGGDTAKNLISPGLSQEASQWIVKNRPSVYGVGIDTINVDRGQSHLLVAHTALTSENIYLLENLTNLDKLPARGARVTVGVLKLGGQASASPARVIASFNT